MKKLIVILSILCSFFTCNQAISDDTSSNISKCNRKNGNACYQVAKDYDNERNYQLAIKYYEKSCALNNDKGCHSLGVIYSLGNNVEKDYFKSFKYYAKACDLNNASACQHVGHAYSHGLGIRQDSEKAGKYFFKACTLVEKFGEDPNTIISAKDMANLGLYTLAISYEQKGDFYQAKKYYGLSCDCHSQSGCDGYAKLNRK